MTASENIAYFNGRWCRLEQLAVPIDDLGFYQSATAVERLRTWESKLRLLPHHLRRFEITCRTLRINGLPQTEALREIIETLCQRYVAGDSPRADFGITLFATPGRRGGNQPTLCVHPTVLDRERLKTLTTTGQPLVITNVQQPPDACWPRSIKVRSRLHYYLADLSAGDQVKGALGVLLDQDGSITETSTSNILMRDGSTLIAPPADRVLPGIMARVVVELAEEAGMQVVRRPISPEELRGAEEVWLTGSEVGLWYANQVDGLVKQASQVYGKLRSTLEAYLET